MLAADETAVICDLAETYGLFDYRQVPLRIAAALAAGLGEESRIKRKLAGVKAPANTLLLAAILDRLSILCWRQTEDGHKGINPPKSMVSTITGETESNADYQGFDTSEDFDAAWAAVEEV